MKEHIGKWSFNADNEYWTASEFFDTREDAINIGKEQAIKNEWEFLFVGTLQIVELQNYFDSNRILEGLDERYSDKCGEGYENDLYEKVSTEDLKWLEDKFSEVIDEFHLKTGIESYQYKIEDIEEIVLDVVA